jgi:hypothetical protein
MIDNLLKAKVLLPQGDQLKLYLGMSSDIKEILKGIRLEMKIQTLYSTQECIRWNSVMVYNKISLQTILKKQFAMKLMKRKQISAFQGQSIPLQVPSSIKKDDM